ncbi:MAG: hypothetical protein ACLFTE_03830 [Salinivenus sp.]
MPRLPAAFSSLPDAAQVWMYPAATPLSETAQNAFLERLEAFIETWTSHQQEVHGAATILHDRFVVLAGHRADGQSPSGCAIDDATHAIEATARDLDVQWVPSLHVLYRTADGTVADVPRPQFQAEADAGTVTTDTMVFDPSISTLGALREGAFEQPAGASWHARAFSLPAPA